MTTREHRFVQVDVFTDRVFGGNPLAMFVDAREMNLSETTFLLPPTRAEWAQRLRIFTPEREGPFAGHDARHRLGARDATPPSFTVGARRLSLEEAIGPASSSRAIRPV